MPPSSYRVRTVARTLRTCDPATWDNPLALDELAAHARLVHQPPHLLAVLGADFWANIGMALSRSVPRD